MQLKEEIKKLVKLQEIDSKIYSLNQDKNINLPQKIENLKNVLENKKKELGVFEEKIKKLNSKKREKELDLATKEESIKKAQVQLYQLKSNKEYQAKLTEIASLKGDISILEEEILKEMEEIEKAEEELKREKEKFLNEEKKAKEDEKKINEEIKKIEEEIKNLEAQRNTLINGIDRNILSKYEKLLRTRSGLAIAPIINENCGACYMRVTPQTINEIKMYKDLVFCESCVRILYIQEDILDDKNLY